MDTTLFAYNIQGSDLSVTSCHGLVSPVRLEQLARRPSRDQLRSLSGDLLVLYALAETGIEPSLPLEYSRNKWGKPYFNHCPEFRFNLSHSGDWVVCACGSRPLGVDIQQEQPVRDALLRYTLSEREYATVLHLPEESRQSAFFRFWCLKEAYCKATGRGLTIPLKEIEVELPDRLRSDPRYQLKLLEPPEPGYAFALCGSGLPEHISVTIISHL